MKEGKCIEKVLVQQTEPRQPCSVDQGAHQAPAAAQPLRHSCGRCIPVSSGGKCCRVNSVLTRGERRDVHVAANVQQAVLISLPHFAQTSTIILQGWHNLILSFGDTCQLRHCLLLEAFCYPHASWPYSGPHPGPMPTPLVECLSSVLRMEVAGFLSLTFKGDSRVFYLQASHHQESAWTSLKALEVGVSVSWHLVLISCVQA